MHPHECQVFVFFPKAEHKGWIIIAKHIKSADEILEGFPH